MKIMTLMSLPCLLTMSLPWSFQMPAISAVLSIYPIVFNHIFCIDMKFKNNPANIRYNPHNVWKGQIEPLRGFCQFSDLKYGLRALMVLLRNYIKNRKCRSVSQIISRFAPVSENNTSGYISFVCNLLRNHDCVTDNIVPFSSSFYWLCVAICYYETNTSVRVSQLVNVAKTYGLYSSCLDTIDKQLLIPFKDE